MNRWPVESFFYNFWGLVRAEPVTQGTKLKGQRWAHSLELGQLSFGSLFQIISKVQASKPGFELGRVSQCLIHSSLDSASN